MRLVSATYFGVLAVNDREVKPAATMAGVRTDSKVPRGAEEGVYQDW